MTTALVFGARGQIGRFLLPRLRQAQYAIHAVTRGRVPDADPDIVWHRFDLFGDDPPELQADVLFSLGPLDGLVCWLQRTRTMPRRVVAFGSTSAASKIDSPDPSDRRLADALRRSESALARACEAGGGRWTLLRPTLVYGAAMDRNLSRIAQLARRWNRFVLPRNAVGLRQPVHAEDLAAAAWCAAQREIASGRGYDLPGGETLSYRDMVARVLACLDPAPRLIEVSALTFNAVLALARLTGALSDAGKGVIARLQDDLVFDAMPAARDLDYSPRAFDPEPGMFLASTAENLLQRSIK